MKKLSREDLKKIKGGVNTTYYIWACYDAHPIPPNNAGPYYICAEDATTMLEACDYEYCVRQEELCYDPTNCA